MPTWQWYQQLSLGAKTKTSLVKYSWTAWLPPLTWLFNSKVPFSYTSIRSTPNCIPGLNSLSMAQTMLPIYLENLTSQRSHPQVRHVWTLYRRFSTSKWTRSMKASRWLSISKIQTLRSYHNQSLQSWVSSILHGTMSHMRLMCSQELTATCYSLSQRSMSTAATRTNC